MVILDYPYISDDMCKALAAKRAPVLRNQAAEDCAREYRLNLMDDESFATALRDGSRLYLNSENALSWVLRNDPVAERVRGAELMKDKHRFRELLRPLYPEYRFAQHAYAELRDLAPVELRFPLVLKPSVGFFSIGVFIIGNAAEWVRALDMLDDKWRIWKTVYPDGVLGGLYFSVEDYIRGDEYAIDAYYDGQGKAVVLSVMKHEFADAADVRDRLYCIRPAEMPRWAARFAAYLDEVGALLRLRDFPFHAEVRVAGGLENGVVMPIEFNPLRFAGCCTTDLARHALGICTWQAFLADERPDWNALPADRRDCYSLIMLDKLEAMPAGAVFDYGAFAATLTEVLDIRTFAPDSPAFGYAFARTPEDRWEELDAILRSDLTEFLRPA